MTAAANPAATLAFTGERFLPDVRGTIWYEHWHRYAAVASLAAGRRVLDAACGEGYGSRLLAQDAAHVTGVDISDEAIAHARERYARANLEFAAASVTALPLPDASVDLVVSFETVEHLAEQEAMLAEFRRVLAPSGVLVISSPNRPVYNEGGGVENHYHVRELDRDELAALLAPAFPRQAWYAQRVVAQSALWAEGASAGAASFVTLAGDRPAAAPSPAPPMYFVVVCGGPDAALPALPALSLFDDGALSLWRDYARALLRARELEWEERDARKIADERETRLVAAVNALASAREAGRVQAERIAGLEAELAATQTRAHDALARLQAALTAEEDARAQAVAGHAHETAAHDATRARLAYRESAQGWLRYPFAAVRQRLSGRS
ncbi:MAG: methyltransferase domain-containing protein [Burkholderiales bacterium]|nr:methyltransferase domain-containing protein [Burkholderiales bacterium]